MYCPQCQSDYRDDVKICPECKVELLSEKPVPKEPFCPNCLKEYSEDKDFCPTCLVVLKKQEQISIKTDPIPFEEIEVCPFCKSVITLESSEIIKNEFKCPSCNEFVSFDTIFPEKKLSDLVVLGSYTYSYKAQFVASVLRSNNINCFIFDNNLVNIMPFFSNLISGVKVLVPKAELIRANTITNMPSEDDKQFDKKQESIILHKKKFVKTQLECPKCHSSSIYKRSNSISDYFLGILGALSMLPHVTRIHFCNNCKHQWESQ